METFVKEVMRDVQDFDSQLDYHDHRPNILLFKEKLAFRELKQSDEIVLKPADKGVQLDRQMYGNEINRQLEDQDVYTHLSSEPTWGKQLEGILKQALKEGALNVIYILFFVTCPS